MRGRGRERDVEDLLKNNVHITICEWNTKIQKYWCSLLLTILSNGGKIVALAYTRNVKLENTHCYKFYFPVLYSLKVLIGKKSVSRCLNRFC